MPPSRGIHPFLSSRLPRQICSHRRPLSQYWGIRWLSNSITTKNHLLGPLRREFLCPQPWKSRGASGIFSQTRLSSTAQSAPIDNAPARSELLSDPADMLGSAPEQVTHTNDYMGFLFQDYGIDFGFGTSTIMKTLFEAVHVYSGLPFWASILMMAIMVRSSQIPLTASAVDNSAKMQAMQPVTKPLMAQLKEASAKGDRLLLEKTRAELKKVYRETNIKMWKFALPLVQVPLGFGCWRTFSNMAHLPVTGMSVGGTAWFTNLTVPDPYYILPFLTAGLQVASVKYAQQNQAAALTEQQMLMQRFIKFGLPVLTVLVISWAPAAIQLHFCCTSLVALITNFILNNHMIRNMFNLTKVPKKPSDEPEAPYKGVINVAGSSTPSHLASATVSPSAPPTKSGIIGRLSTRVMRKFFPGAEKTRAEKVQERKTRAQKKKAKDYEAKRREQIEEERVEWEQMQSNRAPSRRRH